MSHKPDPERDLLRQEAQKAQERVRAALRHLQKILHCEDVPEEDTGEQPRQNGHDH